MTGSFGVEFLKFGGGLRGGLTDRAGRDGGVGPTGHS